MKGLRLLIVIVCCLVFQQLLNAQTSYTSILSGDWNNTAVWSPAGVPGAGDIVLIDQGTIVSTNGQREVAGFNTLVGGELLLSGTDGSLTITVNGSWGGVSGGGIIRDVTPNNNGVVTVASGAVLEIGGNQWVAALYGGARLLNLGTVRMLTGFGIWGQDGSVIENQALFEIDTAGNFGGFPNGGIFINTNTGTFRKVSGMGACNFNANWEFQNLGGTIDVQSGSVTFNCDGIFNGGSYNADAGALLHFDAGNHTFEGTLSGAPAGRIEISAGVTANTGVSGVTLDFQGTGFAWSGGTFTSSMITIPGTGLLVLDEFSFSSELSGGSTLLNLGTIRQDGNLGIRALESSIVDNQSLYEIIADNGSFGGNPNGGIFINTGTFRNMGSGTCSFNANWSFQNLAGGIIDAANGVIDIANFENAQNAIIQGIASVNVHTTFTNDGINAPGYSAGMLTFIGNYIPSSTGVLDIELGGLTPGSGHDQLAVTGNAVLNGTIDVSVTGSFIPAPGDSFVVLTTTGTLSDSFMTVSAQSGLYVDVRAYSNFVTVFVDSVGVLDVKEITNAGTVADFELAQNYPNPFNPSTNIQFAIPQSSFVTLEVFNALGEKIDVLVSEELNAGNYNYNWNASSLTSGIYFYTIQAGSFIETKKMILVK
jgi:hypothetical protein